jgi:hypothetical protein
VTIDEESDRVMHLTVETEPPDQFPVMESAMRVDYGTVRISGDTYLLPVSAEIVAKERPQVVETKGIQTGASAPTFPKNYPGMRYRNLVEFRNYRKFTADSKVSFQ